MEKTVYPILVKSIDFGGFGRSLTSYETKQLRKIVGSVSNDCIVVQCCGSENVGIVYKPSKYDGFDNTGWIVETK